MFICCSFESFDHGSRVVLFLLFHPFHLFSTFSILLTPYRSFTRCISCVTLFPHSCSPLRLLIPPFYYSVVHDRFPSFYLALVMTNVPTHLYSSLLADPFLLRAYLYLRFPTAGKISLHVCPSLLGAPAVFLLFLLYLFPICTDPSLAHFSCAGCLSKGPPPKNTSSYLLYFCASAAGPPQFLFVSLTVLFNPEGM